MPQATTRRARSSATSNPSPTTITSRSTLPNQILNAIYPPHAGKGENLRLRLESSESETTLPQATARRARSEATSNPSPTTITSCSTLPNQIFNAIYPPHAGKDEKLRLRFDSSAARKRCRRQRPEGRGAARRVILPPPPSLHVAHCQIKSSMPYILPMPGRVRTFD